MLWIFSYFKTTAVYLYKVMRFYFKTLPLIPCNTSILIPWLIGHELTALCLRWKYCIRNASMWQSGPKWKTTHSLRSRNDWVYLLITLDKANNYITSVPTNLKIILYNLWLLMQDNLRIYVAPHWLWTKMWYEMAAVSQYTSMLWTSED